MSITNTPKTQLDQRINPVEAFIYKGLADRFYQVFASPLTYTTSKDKKAARAKVVGQEIKYPMAFAVLKSLAIDETRYSSKTLLIQGVTSGSSSDHKLTYKAQLVPTIFSFEVTFLSQDIKEITSLAKTWMLACLGGYLKFSIRYGVVDIDISSELDREVTIPEKGSGLTEINEYEMVTNIKVLGFLSPDNLVKVQAITEVDYEGTVLSKEQYSALDDAAALNGRAFLFKSKWGPKPTKVVTPVPVTEPLFVLDTFTSTDAETLPGHSGEIGAAWSIPAWKGSTDSPLVSDGQLTLSSYESAYVSSGVCPTSEGYIEMEFNRSPNLSPMFFLSFATVTGDNFFANSMRDAPTCLLVAGFTPRLEIVSDPALAEDVIEGIQLIPNEASSFAQNTIRFEVRSTGTTVLINGVIAFSTDKTFDVTGRSVTLRAQPNNSSSYLRINYIKAGSL